jgi:hypothetical protein
VDSNDVSWRSIKPVAAIRLLFDDPLEKGLLKQAAQAIVSQPVPIDILCRHGDRRNPCPCGIVYRLGTNTAKSIPLHVSTTDGAPVGKPLVEKYSIRSKIFQFRR